MELETRTRQKGKMSTIQILDDLETGQPCKKPANRLMELHLNNIPFEFRQEIEQHATYIFSTHKDKNDHNFRQLSNFCNINNPLAYLKYIDCSSKSKGYVKSHYDLRSTPIVTHICVGAKVTIKGYNFQPNWGLFNGAIGTVKEIVFKKGQNPNIANNLPSYVAVEFPGYKPPSSVLPFDEHNPKVCKNDFCNDFLLCGKQNNLNFSFSRRLYQYQ